ncbi:MAG: hypothetical protein FWE16_02290 [Firmicutes bacterium]|nr:hypothetical protein [Bacillota bacterium]
MRSAKNSETFPYTSSTVCYFEVDSLGNVKQLDKQSMETAHSNATSDKSKIYAVWPWQYRSDLFLIDDLNAFADAFDIPREDDHIHDISWNFGSIDDGQSAWVSVDLYFNCGCKLDINNIKKIARDLNQQKGWDMAKSSYGGGHSMDGKPVRYSVSVRRGSLK